MAFSYDLTPREQDRLNLITEKLVADARERGITATGEQIADLPSVKLFVISQHDSGDAMQELMRVPAIRDQARKNEAMQALHDGSSPIHTLNPHQRLTLGHELEAAKNPPPPPTRNMDSVEEARRINALRLISDPVVRLQTAREWGLA